MQRHAYFAERLGERAGDVAGELGGGMLMQGAGGHWVLVCNAHGVPFRKIMYWGTSLRLGNRYDTQTQHIEQMFESEGGGLVLWSKRRGMNNMWGCETSRN